MPIGHPGQWRGHSRCLPARSEGSNNRRAARQTVAARYRRVANQRRYFHHQTTRALLIEFDVIFVEDLTVKNMVKRVAPAPAPVPEHAGQFLANGSSAKAGLNCAISDAGWGQFRSILYAKAEEAGPEVLSVDPRQTSTTCSKCGHVEGADRVKQEMFSCRSCDFSAHADENAAWNIQRAGLALLATSSEIA